MKYDIVLAGVGGQGVLSLAAVIARGAMNAGLHVRQSEVHGMAQRGGAVLSHMRISDIDIPSDLIPRGAGDMILSMEPLESLRYLEYLAPEGVLVTSGDPVTNIPSYPDLEGIYERIRDHKRSLIVESGRLAKEAGSSRAVNTVMIGAASKFLPLGPEELESAIREMFARKGEEIAEANVRAFRLGREHGG
ncbi:MAG: indolepyruvate oxidoreductase subunit beta [Spirochaetia bacterium]